MTQVSLKEVLIKTLMKSKLIVLIICNIALLAISFHFDILPVHAQQFSSSSYKINWGNFNMTSGLKKSTNYQLTDTVGQNAPGYSEKNGIVVKAGFQYIYDTFTELSFSIDKLNINFGTLEPGIGVTDTNLLIVTTPSGRGYQITAQENHPLWISPSHFIPDTTCDANNCTITSSAPWIQNDKYGFGFNVSGVGATGYFTNSTYYRPFASIYHNQTPAIIISENLPVKEREAIVTYRVLISSVQSAGDYQNYITYTLTPKY